MKGSVSDVSLVVLGATCAVNRGAAGTLSALFKNLWKRNPDAEFRFFLSTRTRMNFVNSRVEIVYLSVVQLVLLLSIFHFFQNQSSYENG